MPTAPEEMTLKVIAHIHTAFPTKFGIPRTASALRYSGVKITSPRLGGNTRMGVFATRSPFRPNPLGLASVRLEGIEHRPDIGPVLIVRGADLMDGTPIYDIKPYIPYADCHPDAAEGFTGQTQFHRLQVQFPPELLAQVPQADRAALTGVLAGDPRPSYQHDPQRVYGMEFGPVEVHFTVDGEVLTVTGIARR